MIYYPVKKALRSIGNVLTDLPEPGDIGAGGPLHKLPRLQWKTWMRLALPAGGDWRDLNKVDWENLRVVHELRRGAYEVADWDKPSREVTSTAGPGRSNGVTSISDPRLQINGDGKPIYSEFSSTTTLRHALQALPGQIRERRISQTITSPTGKGDIQECTGLCQLTNQLHA
ncbi:hypothetical protein [Paenibacillus sp. LK1]|uniref:hypothetical protein n=1 Tax=Paenibacillus sp. LK1 TaxID=2053014 RepID=UPI00117E3318|nr:hypothetical protein [Paenibacillus sp. LK1]